MSFTTNVGAPEAPAPAEPAAPPAPREGSGGPTPDAAGEIVVDRRPGENPSEARARALGFFGEGEDEGDAGDAVEDIDTDDAMDEPEAEPRFPWQRPEGLDDDALAEWKEAQGLPASAEDYEDQLELPEGTQITEAGRPLVASFMEFAAANDLPASAVSKAIVWFNEQAGARGAAIKERDSVSKEEATEALRDRWEDAFDDNLAVATAGLKMLPESLQKLLRAARGPDGRKLLHDPDMAQVLFDLGSRSAEGDSGARREEADYECPLTGVYRPCRRGRRISKSHQPKHERPWPRGWGRFHFWCSRYGSSLYVVHPDRGQTCC